MKQSKLAASAPAPSDTERGPFFGPNTTKFHLLALAALCAVIYFYRLGYLPFLGPDEPRYAQIAREMYLSGDWITPRLAGLHWFEKPALLYWLAAAGYTVFGVSEFAARFGVAVLASACVFLLYAFGRHVRSARFGYLSAAALATSGLWVGFGQAATFDLPLAASMALALTSFFAWEQNEVERRGKSWLWLLSCFGMGLAVLAKGLVGVLLPASVIGLFLLLTGRLLALLKRPSLLALGALIFLATCATWYAPMFARHGQEFINEFFIAHHFQRFLTNKYKHPQPFYFFFFVALVGCFPWSVAFGRQIYDSAKHWREVVRAPHERLRLFLWLWALIPILFFSLSTSKLTGYILPVFPGVALLIGLELEKLWAERAAARRTQFITPLLLLLVSFALGVQAPSQLAVSPQAAWTVAALGAAVAVSYLLLMRKDLRRAALFLPFGMAVALLATKLLLLSGLAYADSTRDLALTTVRAAQPGERLLFFINNSFSFDFYATDLPLRDEKSYLLTVMKPQEVEDILKAQPTRSLLVISRERWASGLTDLMEAEKLGEQRDLVLFRLRLKSRR